MVRTRASVAKQLAKNPATITHDMTRFILNILPVGKSLKHYQQTYNNYIILNTSNSREIYSANASKKLYNYVLPIGKTRTDKPLR